MAGVCKCFKGFYGPNCGTRSVLGGDAVGGLVSQRATQQHWEGTNQQYTPGATKKFHV